MGYPFLIDVAILKFFNIRLSNSLFDLFFIVITDFSFWRWPILAAIVILLWKGGIKGRWVVGLTILVVIIIDPTIHYWLKPLFARLRPCHEPALMSWIRTIDDCGGKYGFPSSHAANSAGIVAMLGFFYKSSRYYLYPIAFFISLSRVYLGVHYPSDVLGGAIYGVFVALIVLSFARVIFAKQLASYINKKAIVPIER